VTRRRTVSSGERRARLAIRHRLAPDHRTDAIDDLARGVVSLHASDPASVFLACAARSPEASPDSIEAALYDERSIIRHHAMRRTLWVFPTEEVARAHSSSNRRIARAERRRLGTILEANEVTQDPDAWIDDAIARLRAALTTLGTATTRDLGEEVPDIAVPLSFRQATLTAHARVLLLMGFEGTIVRTRPTGSWISSQYAWSVADEWVDGAFAPLDHHAAAASLADAYLSRFGPATTEDIAWWTGWTMATVRRALDDAGAFEVDLEDGSGWVASGDETVSDPGSDPGPWVALLPGLDPTTMGWKRRDWYLDPAIASRLFDRNGNAGPTVWMDGRIVGGWMQRPSGEIVYRLLDPAAAGRTAEIDQAVARLRAFYGDVRHRVRFPSPIQRDLAGSGRR
jgi:DNA glycosylase AlkZ-like